MKALTLATKTATRNKERSAKLCVLASKIELDRVTEVRRLDLGYIFSNLHNHARMVTASSLSTGPSLWKTMLSSQPFIWCQEMYPHFERVSYLHNSAKALNISVNSRLNTHQSRLGTINKSLCNGVELQRSSDLSYTKGS